MRTHEQFLAELGMSGEAVARVAAWYLKQGLPVTVRPTFYAPTYDQRAQYADDGDLEILLKIEVKHRMSVEFTGKADYPYPTAIIDACSNFDKKRPPPAIYFLVNPAMDVALMANVAQTHQFWSTAYLPSQNDMMQTFYVCPVERLREVRF